MRTVILCLCLALTSWSVAAEDQAKSPKKVTKTSAVKRTAKPGVSQKIPARKKVIKPAAIKPIVVSKKMRSKGADVKGSDTHGVQPGPRRRAAKTDKGRLTMADLPAQCRTVLTAGRTDDTNVAAAALKVVASKEAGPRCLALTLLHFAR
jgi:hypothetical protein